MSLDKRLADVEGELVAKRRELEGLRSRKADLTLASERERDVRGPELDEQIRALSRVLEELELTRQALLHRLEGAPGREKRLRAIERRAAEINRRGPQLTAEVEGLRAQVRERVEVLQAHERELLRLREEFDELKRDVDPSLGSPQFVGWAAPRRNVVKFALDQDPAY